MEKEKLITGQRSGFKRTDNFHETSTSVALSVNFKNSTIQRIEKYIIFAFENMQKHAQNTAKTLYSFGSSMVGYSNAEYHYSYGFQGQEGDDEIKGTGNSINYKYRMHDPRLGRFFAIDPLASNYPYFSPFAFSGNRVVDMVEQEGLQPGYVPQHFLGFSMQITIPTFKKIETNVTYALNLPYYNTPAFDFAQIKQKVEVNLFVKNLNKPFESVLLLS